MAVLGRETREGESEGEAAPTHQKGALRKESVRGGRGMATFRGPPGSKRRQGCGYMEGEGRKSMEERRHRGERWREGE